MSAHVTRVHVGAAPIHVPPAVHVKCRVPGSSSSYPSLHTTVAAVVLAASVSSVTPSLLATVGSGRQLSGMQRPDDAPPHSTRVWLAGQEGHRVQAPLPLLALNVPVGHGTHVPASMPLQPDRKRPASQLGHSVHDVCGGSGVYLPAWHAVQ